MSRLGTITRRSFMGIGFAATGGVALGYYFYQKPYANPLEANAAERDAVFNPYVKISTDNEITIIAPRAEMGQGVHTTLAALVAEELDVSLDKVNVEHGLPGKAYYNEAVLVDGGVLSFFDEGLITKASRKSIGVAAKLLGVQLTGGSSSTIDAYVKMREAGFAARAVLVEAAAARWGVNADTLTTDDGIVTNPSTGERISYGEVAADAAEMELPSKIELRPRSEWKILGKPQKRVDGLEKVTGAPIYSIDVQLPDMMYGTVKMSPHFGAHAISVDTSAALEIPDVVKVVEIKTNSGSGFGIIANNTWAAFQGAEAIEVEWGPADYPSDSGEISSVLDDALNRKADFHLGNKGNVDKAFETADNSNIIEAVYDAPYLAHATMEPMNATAQISNGKLEIWVGTQSPGMVQSSCGALVDIDAVDVTVNTTRMGGGFGRRAELDAPLYATAMAAHANGQPIKVTWSREEDMQHDAYRPVARAVCKASTTAIGDVTAFDYNLAVPSVVGSLLGRLYPSIKMMGPERVLLDGAFDQPISIPNRRYGAHVADLSIPVGILRSVGYSYNGFFHESFLDEIAHHLNMDPLDFRLSLITEEEHKPAREVLKRVAELSGWGSALPKGKGRGIAHVLSFGTWVAQAVMVDVTDGIVTIEDVWCAADPGLVLDPQIFKDQMMSGIVFGLGQAMGQEVTIQDSVVEQSNFHDFDAMRMHQCPNITVDILENSVRMGGAGEPGVPPSLPALANAIFDATGQRIRSLPLGNHIDFA